MRRTHRLSARSRCAISFCVCFALLFSAAGIPLPSASSKESTRARAQEQKANERRVAPLPPRTGPPAPNLPNLDEVKNRQVQAPRAAIALPSMMRSRRKPLEARNGRRVGDPLPPIVRPSPSPLPTPSVLPTPRRDDEELAKWKVHRQSLAYNSQRWGSTDYLLRLAPSLTVGFVTPLSDSPLRLWTTSLVATRWSKWAAMANVTSFDTTALPIPQTGGGKIVFASSRDGFMQIYVMNSDGTGQLRLTTDGTNNENPRWSPDGTKILFQSDRDNPGSGLRDIYVMNSNGSGQTRLTTDVNDDCFASWSSDGTKIVFQSLRNAVSYQIYTMNADGSGQVNISNNGVNDMQPSWSPDGTKIAFASERDQSGFPSVYVMNSNGTNQARLTFSGVGLRDEQPVWSPNGSKIAFTSTRDSATDSWTETDDYEIPEDDGQTFSKSRLNINKEVYLMNADGSGQTRLTFALENDDSPCWSPDGTKIVFRSERERDLFDPSPQIWTMNADGTSQVNLSNTGNADSSPSWATGSANQAPIANAGGPYSGIVGQAVTFNGSGSFDPDGTIISYSWTFGDGTNGSGATPTHTYASAGTHTATLTVADNSGNAGSATVSVTITANTSPTVSITSPANGASFTAPANITITANASDTDGMISKVEFYRGTTLMGTDTLSPYSFSWNNVTPGTYSLTAKATDNLGATTTSAAVSVTVNVNGAPTVSITSPALGASFTAPANITIAADAIDSDGTVSKVDFYQGTTLLGTDTLSPYSFSWTNVAAGTYTLTATATDNSGASGSASRSVTVTPGNQPPVANAGGPYSGVVGQNAPFSGSGSVDPDGSIVSYAWTFGDGGTGSGVAPTHAYGSTGTYSVTVTVTDNLGAQASASTTISVSASTSDQYVTSFLQWGLGRAPTGQESTYWTDIMRAAYPQGLPSMKLATRELGMTVFESAEYAARNRNDHWYVYDLYKTFLMREPDVEGWAHWEAAIPIYGRDQIRRGFDESTEFANIVATLNASGSPSAAVSSLATARVDPFNQSGNQLQARDAEWSANLLSLPGRAGLDLGLTISYSSLVWTNSGPYMYFDADGGSPSPGFHIGFPTIQDKYFDARVGRNVYLLTTTAGRKVELRQVGTSNVYESPDSSYLQLTAGGSLLLRTTDGTSLTFGWTGLNEYRCTSILDRNGNYMVVNYDWRGDIQNVTDTLGRVITFNYDPNANLNSITQTWNGVAHTWASFGWENLTMQPTVSSVVGTYSGETMPVLNMVAFHDGTYTKFLYNGNGQVGRITQYASDSNPATDNHPRNYTAYDYDSPSGDCPRLISTRTWAEYWTGFNGVPTEVTTYFSVEGDTRVLTAPDGTVYKETYAGSSDAAWMRGLVKSSEVRSGGVQQKLSTVAWTQDNTNVVYKANPRVIETNVYDSVGNRRRTTIDYSVAAYAQYGLPYIVREYAADGVTELRRTYRDYNLNQAYLDRRIIGLVSAMHLADAGSFQAKVTYGYDDPARLNSQATTATMHDQSYHGSFYERGNVTSVSRWDVTDINNASNALTSFINYNATGSVASTRDPAGHLNQLGYTDSFSDGNNGRNTLAYPTTLTDADNFSATVQYNFDFGAKTRVEGPPPQSQPNGIIQTFAYDSAARLQRTTTTNTGAYTHNVYGPNYVQSYSSVNNVAANYSQSDLYSITIFDGVGRGFTTTTNHPGSVGGYKLVNVIFDRMGRPFLQSNPTEVNSSWLPAGDDSVVFYSQQSFDWQGRPLRTTHPDGYYKEASYAGCGCAGGTVVTLTDERNRQQKVYSDVLGRSWKTEILTWPDGSGNRSVYSSSVSVFNARHQVQIANQYSGSAPADASSTNPDLSCPTGTCQKTAMSFDGYGRLQSKHAPEQNAGTATVYSYNPDDTIQSVTDARGASATYEYNNGRHLVNHISYEPGGGVTDTPDVWFGYDAVGNRTSMSDGFGSVSYNYNQLSEMTSEARIFTGVGSFTLNYDYNVAGQLKKITDHTNSTINYGIDSTGRLNGITGSDNLFSGVSDYSSGFVYRAWGGVKQVAIGGTHTSSVTYNSRLQATNFNISGGVSNQNYEYYNDGRVSFSHNTTDNRFDRSFSFDHAGRLLVVATGGAARNDTGPVPTYQTFAYNAWDDTVSRDTETWTHQYSDWGSYVNHRRSDWGYDTDGRVATIDTRSYTYDSAGRIRMLTGQRWTPGDNYVPTSTAIDFDGDGQKIREVNNASSPTYYLRSSVLRGAIIEELDSSGQKQFGYVYTPTGSVIARQISFTNAVALKQMSPTGDTQYELLKGEGVAPSVIRRELDPMGADIKLNPWPIRPDGGPGNIPSAGGAADGRFGAIENPAAGCTSNGIFGPCDWGFDPDRSINATFWGDQIGDLPGFGTNWGSFAELSLRQHGRRLVESRFWSLWRRREGNLRASDIAALSAYARSFGLNENWASQDTGDAVRGAMHASMYEKCKGLADIPSKAASLILEASRLEGTDPTLIAVSMKNESSFGRNLKPNPRYDDGKFTGYHDVGWMQIANDPAIWNQAPYTDDLPDAYGWWVSQVVDFNGDPLQNVRLGARALNASSGWKKRPKNVSPRADAAGIYRAGSRGPASYGIRVNEFERDEKRYDQFFKCMRGQ